MDSKVTFEVANSNIWLNHLATTTIIQVLLRGGECRCSRCCSSAPKETGAQEEDHQCCFGRTAVRIVQNSSGNHAGVARPQGEADTVRRCPFLPEPAPAWSASSQDAFPDCASAVNGSRLCPEGWNSSQDQGNSSPSDKAGRPGPRALQRRSQHPSCRPSGGLQCGGRSS